MNRLVLASTSQVLTIRAKSNRVYSIPSSSICIHQLDISSGNLTYSPQTKSSDSNQNLRIRRQHNYTEKNYSPLIKKLPTLWDFYWNLVDISQLILVAIVCTEFYNSDCSLKFANQSQLILSMKTVALV